MGGWLSRQLSRIVLVKQEPQRAIAEIAACVHGGAFLGLNPAYAAYEPSTGTLYLTNESGVPLPPPAMHIDISQDWPMH